MDKQCYLCESKNIKKIKQGVRDDENIEVFKCQNCGLEFLSEFKPTLNNFYTNGELHNKTADFQNWLNRTGIDDIRRFKYLLNIIKNKSILDFGCGSGEFIRLSKPYSEKIIGCEIDKSLTEYYKEIEIDVRNSINQIDEKFDVITMFHVLEHLENPIEILEQLKQKLNKNGKIIIEVPNSDDALLTLYKSKAFKSFTYWSCHLFYYNQKCLKDLIKKCGLKCRKIEYIQRYPYTNHIGWIKDKKYAGQNRYKTNKFINLLYTNILKILHKTDTIIAEVEL